MPDDNRTMVIHVAKCLGDLRENFVFVGGCTTGLLVTDPAMPSVRFTKDVDLIVEIGSRVEYRKLEKALLKKGFRQDAGEGAPICRWVIDDILVDVMPTQEDILGFSNKWDLPAIEQASRINMDGLEIQIVSPPYFLATKIEAFQGRGGGDFMASHDIEDIITVLDGRAEIMDEVKNSPLDLQLFLSQAFKSFLSNSEFADSVPGHLLPDPASQGRLPIILKRIETITLLNPSKMKRARKIS